MVDDSRPEDEQTASRVKRMLEKVMNKKKCVSFPRLFEKPEKPEKPKCRNSRRSRTTYSKPQRANMTGMPLGEAPPSSIPAAPHGLWVLANSRR